MKDFSKQLMTILVSNLKPELPSSPETNRIQGLSGISRAVREINSLMQEEIYGLEMHIVSLTEELAETDSLLIEAKKTMIPHFTPSKSKHRVTTRLSQTLNK